jgi:hypothetical protein
MMKTIEINIDKLLVKKTDIKKATILDKSFIEAEMIKVLTKVAKDFK